MSNNYSNNPIVELSEKIQAIYKKNIETKVVGKTGDDHCPTITVSITLPNGDVFTSTGSNKRIAKQNAAKEALLFI